MFNAIALMVLASNLATANVASPTFSTDYSHARSEVATQRKPMAVFVGTGKDGWNQVVTQSPMDTTVKDMLASKFVCLYIDRNTTQGKDLAQKFDLADSDGLVISDRSGNLQAYSHQGKLETSEITRVLTTYAAPEMPVQKTESNIPAPTPAPVYVPAPVMMSYPATSGCANGRCGSMTYPATYTRSTCPNCPR